MGNRAGLIATSILTIVIAAAAATYHFGLPLAAAAGASKVVVVGIPFIFFVLLGYGVSLIFSILRSYKQSMFSMPGTWLSFGAGMITAFLLVALFVYGAQFTSLILASIAALAIVMEGAAIITIGMRTNMLFGLILGLLLSVFGIAVILAGITFKIASLALWGKHDVGE